jgi:hypothetical protein
MFLDDELLAMCETATLRTPQDVQVLNNVLCRKCESYYKSRLTEKMTNKEAKTILDRTFNLWDSFVRSLAKGDYRMKILAEFFEEHSFKKQLLANKEVSRVYNSL